MLDKMEAHHERMKAKMDPQLKKMEFCPGETESMDLEVNPGQSIRKSLRKKPQ
jgi:hypothetical protein